MRKGLIKEIFWTLGIGILTNWIWYSILGDRLTNGKLLEIQNHDTYIIVPKLFLVVLTFVALLCFAYLLRWIHAKRIGGTVIIVTITLTTVALAFLFFNWLSSLDLIRELGKSLYADINGADRVQMILLSHATLTLTVGIVALFDLTMGYKLVIKRA